MRARTTKRTPSASARAAFSARCSSGVIGARSCSTVSGATAGGGVLGGGTIGGGAVAPVADGLAGTGRESPAPDLCGKDPPWVGAVVLVAPALEVDAVGGAALIG